MNIIEKSLLSICFVINIIICFGIPIGYLIYSFINNKENVKFYFFGMLAFIVSQVFLRIPLMKNVLPKMDWYIEITTFYPLVYSMFLGLTAGIFEEIARFLGFKLAIRKKVKWSNGIAFGIGHGGIEAIMFTGIVNIRNLKMIISEETIRSTFLKVNSMHILLAGMERISAIIIHVGLSLLVLYGIRKRKKIYLGLAILIHGTIDSFIGIFTTLGFDIYFIEVWCVVFAIILGIFIIKSKKMFGGYEIENEKSI
ncbi:YhfC family intramembrane metalloprotease [Clostridium botulinum]|uniref:YhfC family intramembrane metalloprotease n=1 Tax=Clostridium botulinum TaxID=1491 RepID=UPI00052E139A|nr:YhfC family glutamic-type intramembrane protease [Clostridium botulinum]KGM92787.1 hypothetical protein Z956_13335 [Clostridium botulinum D str. CCUG 7971]KGM92932.1 hypothetical protein Z956_13075 [Clostridium botulinum D str. CCUG 7971]KOC49952.1 hypothetical protein ADU88_04440 [Clostridium botulinum]MCD3351582.1 YhfC family intramembrane metalloprotease [Clostridium botulinum D/C]MCD3360527.1 YhfC family intramembrane metalloprotease [Clostridium botulinum D/C]